jgi:D-beta-D-heptose 7-phosphate kinase/D-beta-D-heptose 1-phosphate adenosyltransferase
MAIQQNLLYHERNHAKCNLRAGAWNNGCFGKALRDQKYLIPIIEHMDTATVACAGDLMLDSFVYGEVSRISPEAPIPVLRVERYESMPGGAGNAVRNLGALGCKVQFFSATGDDAEAATVREMLGALPGVRTFVEREPGRQTPVKTRYVAQGQQLLRADRETTTALGAPAAANVLSAFASVLPQCSIALLSDYAKGMLGGDLAHQLIQAARAARKPVIVDPKGRDFSRYRGATLIKPNLRELGEATGMPVAGDRAQEKATRKLLLDTAAENILVTRGAEGMMLVPAGGPALQFPSLAREVYDVSGAGDTVAAVLAAAIGSGASVPDAVNVANIAAGIAVGRTGTAVVDRAAIIDEVRHRSAMKASDKVFRLEQAAELAREWTEAGLNVGFTNGCFDLLHPGHLKVLEMARAHCDRLLVGLNSDRSVKRLKGESRPAQDEMSRALVLASLSCVDGVVIFEEDTPVNLIRSLRPKLLVKGGEYSPQQVAGADLVESWGGQLLLVEMAPGWSTTTMIAKLSS